MAEGRPSRLGQPGSSRLGTLALLATALGCYESTLVTTPIDARVSAPDAGTLETGPIDAHDDLPDVGAPEDTAPPPMICGGVECDSPPMPECVDGELLRAYAEPAVCVAGECSYALEDVACELGCDADTNACIESACPASYDCPNGSTYSRTVTEARCTWSIDELPAVVFPYCLYFDMGYVGYSWNLVDDPDYTCPPSARQAGNGAGGGFCLWEELDAPSNAVMDCEELTSGTFAFYWSC